MNLNPQHHLFVDEYLASWSPGKAAEAAGFAYSYGTNLIANLKIRTTIQARIDEQRAAAALPTPQDVMRRFAAIAFADPNDLVSYRISCCRHCHGVDFKFQWRDEAEWAGAIEEAISKHESKLAKLKADDPVPTLTLPDAAGGFQFDHSLLPHDDCPRCKGDGVREVIVADTRLLKGNAKALYAGVKQTKDGIEVKMHSQLDALTQYARCLGMLNDKLTVITPGGGGVLEYTLDDVSHLDTADLEALERAQLKLTEVREKRLERPPQAGDIIDVP